MRARICQSIIVILVILAVISTILIPRIITREKAISYFNNKYGNTLDASALEIASMKANVFSGIYQAEAALDDVRFKIDISTSKDTYVKEATRKRYQQLFFENYEEDDIDSVCISAVDEDREFAIDLGKRDIEFYLEVYSSEDLNTKELLAERTLEAIQAVKNAELIACNTLTTQITLENKYVYLQVDPFRESSYTVEDLLRSIEFSSLEGESE